MPDLALTSLDYIKDGRHLFVDVDQLIIALYGAGYNDFAEEMVRFKEELRDD